MEIYAKVHKLEQAEQKWFETKEDLESKLQMAEEHSERREKYLGDESDKMRATIIKLNQELVSLKKRVQVEKGVLHYQGLVKFC